MLSRRKFLASLSVVPVLTGAIARAEYEDRTPQMLKNFGELYRKYRLLWTGWKEAQSNDFLVGQWIAYPCYPFPLSKIMRNDSKYPKLYSSVPGSAGRFYGGDYFDISLQGHQKMICLATEESIRDMEMRKGKKFIMQLVDCVMDSGKHSLPPMEWNDMFHEMVFPKWKQGGRYANL